MKGFEIPSWVVNEKALYRYIMTFCNECYFFDTASAAECEKCRKKMKELVENWKKLKSIRG